MKKYQSADLVNIDKEVNVHIVFIEWWCELSLKEYIDYFHYKFKTPGMITVEPLIQTRLEYKIFSIDS